MGKEKEEVKPNLKIYQIVDIVMKKNKLTKERVDLDILNNVTKAITQAVNLYRKEVVKNKTNLTISINDDIVFRETFLKNLDIIFYEFNRSIKIKAKLDKNDIPRGGPFRIRK